MDILPFLEAAKMVLSLSFLTIASILDYKERRVPDMLFIVFGAVALITITLELVLTSIGISQLLTFLLYITISSTAFYGIFYLGLYGGADAIILSILSAIMPWPPSTQNSELMLAPNLPIFAFSVLNNTLIVSALIAPYALISNLYWKLKTRKSLFNKLRDESLLKKIVALLFCLKVNKSRIKPYDMIAEESGKIILSKVREEDLTTEEIDKAPENVFIIFSIPMVIFITVGFLISLVFGDLIVFLIKTFWFQFLQ